MKKNIVLSCITLICMVSAACQGGNTNSGTPSGAANNSSAMNDTTGTTEKTTTTNKMNLTIGERILTATLADNSSAEALKEALSEAPITVDMRDYGNMEKVGGLGRDLPANDEQITTEAGDIILFRGNALVIYYAPNSWNFTRLGKIDNVSGEELKDILGDGNVTVILSLPQD